jgi:hypothetical protein
MAEYLNTLSLYNKYRFNSNAFGSYHTLLAQHLRRICSPLAINIRSLGILLQIQSRSIHRQGSQSTSTRLYLLLHSSTRQSATINIQEASRCPTYSLSDCSSTSKIHLNTTMHATMLLKKIMASVASGTLQCDGEHQPRCGGYPHCG